MEFQEFWKNKKRMCESIECVYCEINKMDNNHYCSITIKDNPKEAEAIVQKWIDEHPIKTNADKFKEVFGVEVTYGRSICQILKCDGKCDCCDYKNDVDWWNQEYIPSESVEE